MILLRKIDELISILPPLAKGFVGLYLLGLLIIIPDLVLAITLILMLFSFIYTMYYKSFTWLSECLLNK